MSINKTCLRKIQSVMKLPAVVEVISSTGQVVTTAKILPNGAMIDISTGKLYLSPSQLRADLVASNSGTYGYLRYNGKTLRDLGVGR